MIWCCWHRHPYGHRHHPWLRKDNGSEINTANPVFGVELVNGRETPIYHVNFIRISEKYFDSFWRHVHFNMSIEQERFIKRYLYEAGEITDNNQQKLNVPLDTYDKILASLVSEELNTTLEATILLQKQELAEYLLHRQPLEDFIERDCFTLALFRRSLDV